MTRNVGEYRYTNEFVGPLNEKQAIVKSAQFDREVEGLRKAFAYGLMEVTRERGSQSLTTASPPLLLMDQIVYGNEDLDAEIEKSKQEARDMLDAPHVPFDFDEKYLGCASAFPFHPNDRRCGKRCRELGDDIEERIIGYIAGNLHFDNLLKDGGKDDDINHREQALKGSEKTIKILGQYIYTEVVNGFIEEDEDFDIEIIYFGDEVYNMIDKKIRLYCIDERIKVGDIGNFFLKNKTLLGKISEEIYEYFQTNLEKYEVQRAASTKAGEDFDRAVGDIEIFKAFNRILLLKKLSTVLLTKYSIVQIEGHLDYFEFLYGDDLKNIEGELIQLFQGKKVEENTGNLSKEKEKLEKLFIRIGNDYIRKYASSCNIGFEELFSKYKEELKLSGRNNIEPKRNLIRILSHELRTKKLFEKLNFVDSGSVSVETEKICEGDLSGIDTEGRIFINSLTRGEHFGESIGPSLLQFSQKFKYFLYKNPDIQKKLDNSDNFVDDLIALFPFLENKNILNHQEGLSEIKNSKLNSDGSKSFEELYQQYIRGTQTLEAKYGALDTIVFCFYNIIDNRKKNIIHNSNGGEEPLIINSLQNILSGTLSEILNKFESELDGNPELLKKLGESDNIEKDLKEAFPFLQSIEESCSK